MGQAAICLAALTPRTTFEIFEMCLCPWGRCSSATFAKSVSNALLSTLGAGNRY